MFNFKDSVIGVVFGSGEYPRKVVRACIEGGADCCVVFVGDDDASDEFREIPSIHIKIGKIGAAIDFFRQHNVKKVVFAGAVKRPNFRELSLDAKGASWLLKLGRSIFAGDDALLRAVATLLQEEGFEIVAGTEIIGNVFVKTGILSAKKPTEEESRDIKKGFEVAKTVGALDIGQSVIVCDGDVLGVECVEGTDALIQRCATLRKSEYGGVLVKASKPQQDQRLDLPTVGLDTLVNLHKYHFSGLAVESGHCIILDKDQFIKQCADFSIFFVGVDGLYERN